MKPSHSNSSIQERILNTDADLEKYCALAIEAGATHAKQIHPGSVVTEPWVRLKCQFGCPRYAKGHCCPPHTPDHEQTQAILERYRRAILLHVEIPYMADKAKPHRKYFEALVDIEGEMFKDGYYKAFVFLSGPCTLCKKCKVLESEACEFPGQARPSMESCGIDVYQTARNNGFSIQTLRARNETGNRYCLMMVD